MHPLPPISDDPTVRAVSNESSEYKYDNAVVHAIVPGLLFQLFLALVIAVLLVSVRLSSSPVFPFLVLGCVCVEFGLGLFLCHCVYLFPRESPSRIVGAVGCVVIAGVQLAPVSAGYALGPLFVYMVGISITGWLLHRLLGASLSMNGADVFQAALGTKVLLLVAPLFLLLGIVPVVTYAVFVNHIGQLTSDFAPTIVYASLGMLAVSVFPILTIYLGFFLLRLRAGWSLAAMVLIVIFAASPMVLEWLAQSSVHRSLWTTVSVLSYCLGVGIAYLPFHLRGFRPVWAKRKHKPNAESFISFDDIQ